MPDLIRPDDDGLKRRLTALLEVTNELSKCHSLDEVCRQAVELGRSRLHFERLSIWLLSEDRTEYVGSFGTDETGRTRDERGCRHPIDPLSASIVSAPTPTAMIRYEGALADDRRRAVGTGHYASVAMMDGEKVIGFMCMDNLLAHRPVSDHDCEVLGLYASALAHLCSRVQAEEALRRSDRTERAFRQRLAALLEVSNELSKIDAFDALCRRAIELGMSRLGFERLGMWFFTEDRRYQTGSFGTDEHGTIRDERDTRLAVDMPARELIARRNPTVALRSDDAPLRNSAGETIGRGSYAYATIWDGERITGTLFADNLLKGGTITDQTCELLAMYASVLGHLCSRKRAEEAHLAKVRKLTIDAEKSLETERARISKELHDELGQVLTALNMNLAWIGGRLGDAPAALRERLGEAKANVDRVMRTTRDLTRSLRPHLLDHKGLLDALRSHVSEYEQRAGIACRLSCHPPNLEIGDPPAMAVYRIAQEALTNVARHAKATECEVSLHYQDGVLELKVVDNGEGADGVALSGARSLGIIGMRERAAALGGFVTVANAPNAGVCVSARLPWSLEQRVQGT